MTVSYAIQAHPARRTWAEALSDELGGAPIAWAEPPYATSGDWRPVWRTKRAALLMATDEPFHCVVQDDAILAPDFRTRVETLVERHGGGHLYMLFFRQKRAYPNINRLAIRTEGRGGFTYRDGPILGPGMIFPTTRIAEMIAACDRDPRLDGDDDRIKRWQRASDLDVYVPLPSLVDHREGPSLTGQRARRRAWRMAS